MEKGVFIFLLLELTVVLSSPISFDFNIIGKQGSNLISFSENPSLSIQYDNQAVLGEFCFGSDNQCFDMQIDMNSLTTWVADSENKQSSINRFNKKRSETCQIGKEVEIEYEDGRKISGYNVQDKLKIGDTSIDSFSFISAVDSKDFSDINGMISLGCSNGGSDEKYSLLSQLADKGIIKHKVVTVEFVKQTKGTLTIGKLPPEAVSDYNNYGTCDIESEKTVDKIVTTVDRPWYCNVKGLIIGRDPKRDTVYDFAVKKGKFDLTTNKTFLPLTYLLKMNKEYFSNLMKAGECNFGFKEGYYTFTCIKDNYDLPAITIMFEKWEWLSLKEGRGSGIERLVELGSCAHHVFHIVGRLIEAGLDFNVEGCLAGKEVAVDVRAVVALHGHIRQVELEHFARGFVGSERTVYHIALGLCKEVVHREIGVALTCYLNARPDGVLFAVEIVQLKLHLLRCTRERPVFAHEGESGVDVTDRYGRCYRVEACVVGLIEVGRTEVELCEGTAQFHALLHRARHGEGRHVEEGISVLVVGIVLVLHVVVHVYGASVGMEGVGRIGRLYPEDHIVGLARDEGEVHRVGQPRHGFGRCTRGHGKGCRCARFVDGIVELFGGRSVTYGTRLRRLSLKGHVETYTATTISSFELVARAGCHQAQQDGCEE